MAGPLMRRSVHCTGAAPGFFKGTTRAVSDMRIFFKKIVWPLAALVLLAGCAVTVPARVTTFQQWPADAMGGTWRLDVAAEQRDNLEYGNYADMIRSGMGSAGLVEAEPGKPARFALSFTYGVQPVRVVVPTPAYAGPPPFYYGYRRRFGWGPYPYAYEPAWVPAEVTAAQSYLKVEIRDAIHGNQKVYESTATHTDMEGVLPPIMPYLVRAIFDWFPDANGLVRDVDFEVDRY